MKMDEYPNKSLRELSKELVITRDSTLSIKFITSDSKVRIHVDVENQNCLSKEWVVAFCSQLETKDSNLSNLLTLKYSTLRTNFCTRDSNLRAKLEN